MAYLDDNESIHSRLQGDVKETLGAIANRHIGANPMHPPQTSKAAGGTVKAAAWWRSVRKEKYLYMLALPGLVYLPHFLSWHHIVLNVHYAVA